MCQWFEGVLKKYKILFFDVKCYCSACYKAVSTFLTQLVAYTEFDSYILILKKSYIKAIAYYYKRLSDFFYFSDSLSSIRIRTSKANLKMIIGYGF